MNAEKIKEKIGNRTLGDKCCLWTIRFFTISINIGIIFAGILGIITTQNNTHVIMEKTKDYVVLNVIAPYLPQIIISTINLVTPTVTKWITALERWDYPETRIMNNIIRSYIAKMFNLVVFLSLNLE